ncbi:MAG: GldG family protein [Deltaproteobacteria bacterium]|nr:GldG family protein [Deltaproteobacteria bacterium]
MERKTRAATETGLYLAILAGIVIVVNVLSHGCGPINGVYSRADTTRTERFTLSKGSGRLLGTLKQPITAEVYVTKGLAKLNAFVHDLEDLLKEYERAGGGKFVYKIIEAKSDEQKAAAKEAGLKEAAFGEGSETGEDKASIAQGYMGIVFKYGSEKDTIPIMSPDRADGLEFWMTNKIREVRDKADDLHHRIGVVSGKDEIKLSEPNLIAGGGKGAPSMKSIMEQNFPFYKFEEVDLKDGATEIDEKLDGLVITQPGKDFNDKELRRIDQFVMKGKSLAIFASAVNLKNADPSMKATMSMHNLDKLMNGYGVEMAKDVNMDWNRQRIPITDQQGRVVGAIRAPGLSQPQYFAGLDGEQQFLDNSFAGFFRIEEIAFPFASSLTPHADKQPGAKVKVVARTTPGNSSETGDSIDFRPSTDKKPKPPFTQKAIAIVVEGKLKSAMGGGDADGISIPAESKAEGRVIVVSSSAFLANPYARAGNGPDLGPQFAMMGNIGGDEMLQQVSQPYAMKYLTNTILAFKNLLDWMSGDTDLIAASAKILGEPNLTYADIQKPNVSSATDEASLKQAIEEVKNQRKKVQTNVQWTLTALLPLLFAAYGIARWRMRENARAHISLD